MISSARLLLNPLPSGVGASICVLLTDGSPAAIFLRVASTAVYSINCLACWSFAHVSKKVFKLHPAFTHRDATRSVKFPFGCFGACATVLHGLPSFVRWGVVHPMLRVAGFRHLFHPQASAGLCRRLAFGSQVGRLNSDCLPACADAAPVGSRPFDVRGRGSATQDCQTSKVLTS